MQIVWMAGGLGNQIQNYIYGRYLEYKTGEPVFYDDSWFYIFKCHNGYELKRVFGLNLSLLSDYFPKPFFREVVKNKMVVAQFMRDAGVDIDVVRSQGKNDVPFGGKIIDFNKDTAFCFSENSRYHITYASEYAEYYSEIKEIIDRELVFPPYPNEKCRSIAREISTCNSVGMHIRLGDFEQVGWLSSPEYYLKSIKWTEKNIHPDKYYVFSNDQEYCKTHMKEYGFDIVDGKIEFVEGNKGEIDYVDFQLMTLCKHLVVTSHSTFSGCASVLNKSLETKIDGSTIGMDYNSYFGWKKE